MSSRVFALVLLFVAGCPKPPPPQTCEDGLVCEIDACRVGRTVCIDGESRCAADVTTRPDGFRCKFDSVCRGGACVSCVAGAKCTQDLCHEGVISCDSGEPACAQVKPLPDGSICGLAGFMCRSGDCVQGCIAGVACQPNNRCHTGKTVCRTTGSTCQATTDPVADGTSCGADFVCRSGQCVGCKQDAPCDLAACRKGQLDCSGTPVCRQVGTEPNGQSCGGFGFSGVCNNGSCESCNSGSSCSVTANVCHKGAITCATGAPVCTDAGTETNGTSCGAGQECWSGACITCTSGAACTPANICKRGAISCATGAPVCHETVSLNAGAGCPGGVCNGSGTCVACQSGAKCGRECFFDSISCASGGPVCTNSSQKSNGSTCSIGFCLSGSCLRPSKLELVSGDGQSVTVTKRLAPITFRLTNNGQPVQGTEIRMGTEKQTTAANGTVSFAPWVSLTPGINTFTAVRPDSVPEFESSVTVTATGVAPAAGTLLTVVNIEHQLGNGGDPAVALRFPISTPRVLASLPNGRVWFNDSCGINAFAGDSVTVGTSRTCGFSASTLNNVVGLARDAGNGNLFVADGDRIKRLRFGSSGTTIVSYAGGATLPAAADGDDGRAIDARLPNLRHVAFGPDGALYVTTGGRVRRINPVGQIIRAFFTPPAQPDCTKAVEVVDCQSTCAMTWDSSGRAYLTARVCGTAAGVPSSSSAVGALVRLDAAGPTYIAGPFVGEALVADASDNLFVAADIGNTVWRIDATTHALTRFAGSGAVGDAGDFGPAPQAELRSPSALAFTGEGHLLIADQLNHALRLVW